MQDDDARDNAGEEIGDALPVVESTQHKGGLNLRLPYTGAGYARR